MNIGTSFVSKLGVGFPALFQNKPTNPDAKLNFAIRFTGEGIMSPCSYKNGVYSGDGAGPNADGCTVSVNDKNSEVPADRHIKGKRRRRKHSNHRLRGQLSQAPGPLHFPLLSATTFFTSRFWLFTFSTCAMSINTSTMSSLSLSNQSRRTFLMEFRIVKIS